LFSDERAKCLARKIAIAICISAEKRLGTFSKQNGAWPGGTIPAGAKGMSRLYLSPEESTPRAGTKKPLSEKIGALTFHLYVQNGCPEGRETDFWRRAREMVEERGTLEEASGTSAAG